MERSDICQVYPNSKITASRLNAKLPKGLEFHSVFNAAGEKKDGIERLIVRAEDYTGHSALIPLVIHNNGEDFDVMGDMMILPEPGKVGYEDPRMVWSPDLKKFVITYVTWQHGKGPIVSLMTAPEDFSCFEKIGKAVFVGEEKTCGRENKDACLLPRKVNIDGKPHYGLIHRPIIDGVPRMYISFCDNDSLQPWDKHEWLADPRGGVWWDGKRIGLSAQPLEVLREFSKDLPEGELLIDHGVKDTTGGGICRQGLMWLSLEGPKPRITHRSEEWIMGPKEALMGDVHSVVFMCSAWIEGDKIISWCGFNDSVLEKVSTDLSKAMSTLRKVC